MNLSHLKKLSEDDDYFHVQDMRAGDSFRVAKKGLSPELHGHIAQHFATGGEAESAAQWAKEHPGEDVMPEQFPTLSAKERFDAMESAKGAGAGVNPSSLLQSVKDWAHTDAPGATPAAVPGVNFTPAPSPDPGPQPGVNMSSMDGPAPGDVPPPVQPQPLPQAPARAPGTGGPRDPTAGFARQLGAVGKQEEEAIHSQERVAADKAAFDLAASQHLEQQQNEAHQLWGQRYEQNMAQQQKLQQDIASGEISADKWWHSRSAAQQVAGTIGLILGGIGQAFGGGENQAKALIDKSIAQDIDAQKANLGKKQTLLGDLMRQGYSIQDAEKLATAHAQAVYQGALAKGAAQTGTANAAAIAQKTIADLKGSQLSQTQEVMQRGFQNHIELAKLAVERAKAGVGKPLLEQDVGKLSAQKDAPEAIKHIENLQKDVGLSGYLGAITPEGMHFGAQRQLDNAVNAAAGPLSVASFPLARTESQELTKMVKEQMPTGWQSSAAAHAKLKEMETNIRRASASKLGALAAGGANPAEIAALRIRDSVQVIGPDGSRGTVDRSQLGQLPPGFRLATP